MVCSQAADLPSVNLFAETYGPGSRCIEQGRQWALTANGSNTTSPVFGGGCYQVMLCIPPVMGVIQAHTLCRTLEMGQCELYYGQEPPLCAYPRLHDATYVYKSLRSSPPHTKSTFSFTLSD